MWCGLKMMNLVKDAGLKATRGLSTLTFCRIKKYPQLSHCAWSPTKRQGVAKRMCGPSALTRAMSSCGAAEPFCFSDILPCFMDISEHRTNPKVVVYLKPWFHQVKKQFSNSPEPRSLQPQRNFEALHHCIVVSDWQLWPNRNEFLDGKIRKIIGNS